MSVNYSEYNQVHLPRADHLFTFMKNLEHAMQKTTDYEGAMHQLRCIGYSEEFIQEMQAVAHDYKEFHKARIKAEHDAKQPATLAQQYPTILPARLEQYAANIRLIEQINEHDDVEELCSAIADAIAQELDLDIDDLLKAYCSRDVDAMLCAITGWDLESLLAKAKIIPDVKELFYKPGDFPAMDVTFPFYGKECLSEGEFKDYLRFNYAIYPEMWKVINNVVDYAKRAFSNMDDRSDYMWSMLEGTIGVPEEVVRMVKL